jgi:hypothetical protein
VELTEEEFEEYLVHFGTPRHSGRYPWGTSGWGDGGTESDTRNPSLLDQVNALKKQGLTEAQIAQGLGMSSTTQLRAMKSIDRAARKQADINMAWRLKEKGNSTNAIAKRMGIPEPTARNLLRPGEADKHSVLENTASMLRQQVAEKRFVDVGKGVENSIGVSSTRLDTAVAMLEQEGYKVHAVNVPQVGRGQDTRRKVLGPSDSTQKEVWQNPEKVQLITSSSDNGGRSFTKIAPPMSVNPKRVGIIYGDQGGGKADGLIYVRPGVPDVSLGGVQYAQVRVKVGDGHYLKGMALYKDGLPDGIDLQFNTPKQNTGNKLDVMKELTPDPDLPFGSIVRQIVDKPGASDAKPVSVMNIVNDEGDWERWSRSLSSQMLSKQSPKLAKTQLDMTYERRENDFNSINELTNSTVRKKLLTDFAGATDSAAVHLKAAALPGQAVKVLLPVSSLPSTQIYAPGFKNGDRVVLIRHPHGGTFEIPELIVNNNHAESKRLLGDARVAVGINHEVAKHLSGADFDGDTVLVIPNREGKIKVSRPLDALKDFDPVASYPSYEGMRVMRNTQTEMGKISNLITDMSIANAPHEEIARAVKHSMVVIDAEKKGLDYRQSYTDNNIKQLVNKYQRQPDGKAGAATLISRARSEVPVPQRQLRPQSRGGAIDPKTGALVYEPTNRPHWKTGKPLTTKIPRIVDAKDALELSSGTTMEYYYAQHSNKLQALANRARLTALKTPPSKYSASARAAYPKEVASLDSKLALAKSNAPLERQAQAIANSVVKTKKNYNPNMDKKTLKKVETQAINEARIRTGAGKARIVITDKEWDAIQAGAISDSKLNEILTHANMQVVREHATPKTQLLMTPTKTMRAEQMLASGYTRADVAAQLGVSLSTLDRSMS